MYLTVVYHTEQEEKKSMHRKEERHCRSMAMDHHKLSPANCRQFFLYRFLRLQIFEKKKY